MLTSSAEADQIAAARHGDDAAFERLVAVHQARLHAYCYRILGSVHDADDALQETLLAAWRGLGKFEGRSELRSWLYRIATHACLRLAASKRRPAGRVLSPEHGPARRLRPRRAGDRTGLARARRAERAWRGRRAHGQ
jgi:RNA polymerase sigma-70 factor (ECF subfamily)